MSGIVSIRMQRMLMHAINESFVSKIEACGFNAGVPVTAIRELRVLQSCKHPNVVSLKKIVTASKPDR